MNSFLRFKLLLNLEIVSQVIYYERLNLRLILYLVKFCAPLVQVVVPIVVGQVAVVHQRDRNPRQKHQQDQNQQTTALGHWDVTIVLSGFELVSLVDAIEASE